MRSIIFFCTCLLSILILLFTSAAAAADSLTANQTLSDGETIVSAQGEFEMGFFSPKGGIPQNRYFGIWYKKISTGTVVWVANRDTPISNTSGIIRISTTSMGIVLLSTNNQTIWSSFNHSTSSTVVINNPVAQLLDTGNLVFRDENDKLNFVWQSFDHPVDNFLPGMKFGFDLVTGIDRFFLPWKTDTDPSPGNYLHRLDKNGYPQLILWKDSVVWYRTGPWVGSRFSGIPTLKPNGIYVSRFVITPNERETRLDDLSDFTSQ